MTPGWIESRLGPAESRLEYLIRYLQDLLQQLRSAQQSARTANQQYPSFGPGVGAGAYLCLPGSSVTGATGTWPAITPVSFTANVYQVQGTAITEVAASATVYNWLPATVAASKVCWVFPDGQGNWVVVSQSCT